MPAPLTLLVAAALALSSVAGLGVGPSGGPSPSPTPPPGHGPGATGNAVEPGPIISLTVDNWGAPVSTLDPSHPAWGRLASVGGPATVTLTVDTNGGKFFGYAARLTAPDAPGGGAYFPCLDENHVIESAVVCVFQVPFAAGRNRLDVEFQALNARKATEAHGVVLAGALASNAGLQVRRADGTWQNVPNGGKVSVSPSRTSALRYIVLNSGQIPFRVSGSCSQGAVHVDGVLVCPLRAARPGVALGGVYHVPVRLVDAGGGIDEFTIDVDIDVDGAFRA